MDAEMYKKKFHQLVVYCHNNGMKVCLVPKDVLKDYAGMNWWAARMMSFPFPNKQTIYVAHNMTWKDRYETLRHEIDEIELMRKGMKYWPAHKKALKGERKLTIPKGNHHINSHRNQNHHILMEVRN